MKILMGGVDSWFDELDEKKVSMNDEKQSGVANTFSYRYGNSSRLLTNNLFFFPSIGHS